MARADRSLEFLPPRVLLDGGLGTALIARGLRVDEEPAVAWNLSRPDMVAEVHRAFVLAGAQVLQTNTFTANRIMLRAYGLEHETRRHNVEGALIARSERPEGGWVAGSLGPTGEVPPPHGDANLAEMEEAYAEQAEALADGGVDLLHVETLYHPKEARAALRGCRLGAPQLPVVASMTCRLAAGDTYATTMGFSADTLLSVFLEEKADGLGVNCTLPPADLVSLVTHLTSRTRVPVFAQPTAAPYGGAPLFPHEFAEGLVALAVAGARAIGGCCGTGPADIAAAASSFAALPMPRPRVETRQYGT